MGKYLITGRQGSGKTTLIKMLQAQGYTAYNTDDISESTKLQDKKTGEVIEWPEGPVDWSKYAWNWQPKVIQNLLSSADDVFIGAIVANQTDFYEQFDRVFVLTVNEQNIRKRLNAHEHKSHHLPGEIDRIVAAHERGQQKLLKLNAEEMDANRAAEEILEDIFQKIGHRYYGGNQAKTRA